MDILIPIILIVVSLLISLFGSIVGFGGGIFMVPIMVTFFNYDLDVAAGAAMISLVPSSLISTFLNRRKGHVDFKAGILLEIPTMIGVVLGTLILSYFSSNGKLFILEVIFALMILIIGINFFINRNKGNEKEGFFYKLNKLKPRFVIKNEQNHVAYRISLFMDLVFGLAAGSLAGLFGVGGGFMKTPIMLKVFKIPAKIAAATALFMIVITSITGTFTHWYEGHIIFNKAWPILIGFTLGAILGYKVNAKIKESVLEKLIGISLISAGVIMLLKFVIS